MAAILLLAALVFGSAQADSGGTAGAPIYSADSITNSASGAVGVFAPNTFISIYGQNLSRATRSIAPGDIAGGTLPTMLGTSGVRVLINNIPADLWYVSPTLVNALIPTLLVAGPARLQLEVDGVAGPEVQITLANTAPALWQTDATTILGVHLDGSLVSANAPAHPGEVIVLFATGLGPTQPAQVPNQLAQGAAQIAAKSQFDVLLNATVVDPARVLYAGAAPGTAGVYQINLLLPENAPKNPELTISTSERTSPAGRVLPLEPRQ